MGLLTPWIFCNLCWRRSTTEDDGEDDDADAAVAAAVDAAVVNDEDENAVDGSRLSAAERRSARDLAATASPTRATRGTQQFLYFS